MTPTDQPRRGAGDAGDPYVPDSGNGGYAATHYDLELTYRPAANRLSGRARIHAVAAAPLDRFSLDLAALSASKVLVDGQPAKHAARGRKLVLVPRRPLVRGAEFVVDVRYGGNPRPVRGPWGDVGWEELSRGALVAGQPNGAASWFPCNDHPSDKATYRISLTVDSPFTVVSNGVLLDKKVGASTTTWVYEQPEPMATYLATVQVGQYQVVELRSQSVRQQAAIPPRLAAKFKADFAAQPQMMATFERLFGPYPFARYVVVVADDDLDIPLEAQGLSVFGANHVDGRQTYERLVAHELAHQWFGNSLTVSRWQHIWLNEGFACYAEWLWSEASGGSSADRLAVRARAALAELPQDLVIADPGPQRMFDDRLYKRGALTLHAVRCTVGDDAFFTALRAWTTRNRHGTVSTEDFIAHMSTVGTVGGNDVAGLLTSWLFDARLPKLPASGPHTK